MDFKQLNERVIKWANNKGILEKATPLTQLEKTKEEINELNEALIAQNNNLEYYINSKGEKVNTQEQIIDGIGDTLVTILIQAKKQNLNPLECLDLVLDIIEKRTGKMINGKFVKDEK